MAFNPNAIFISPSSLSDFDKCPQLYYYRNIYRTPRGLKIQIINPALALGQAMHDTLEIFTRLLPNERTKDSLVEKLNFAWKNLSGVKGGFKSAEEENIFKNRALSMLDRFFNNEHFKSTEVVKIPNFPKAELGEDIILTGKLDWLEMEGDYYHLVDFKTGKNEEKQDSQQLPIYALLISKVFNTDKIKASYWYLDKDNDVVGFGLRALDETLKDIKRKGEIIKMVRQTSSFRCQSGKESCWACRDMLSIFQGKGKLVSMDPINRKQEIYILPEANVIEESVEANKANEANKDKEKSDELPF